MAPGAGLGAVTILLVAVGLFSIILAPPDRRRAAAPALAVGASAILLPLLLALAGGDVFLFRNLQEAWVPLAVAIAIGLSARTAGLVVGGILCLAWVAIWASILQDEGYHRDDWESAVTTLGKPREQRALIPGYAMPPVARYGHFGFDATKPVRAKELVVIGVFHSRGAPARSIRGLTLAGRRQLKHIGIARYRSREAVTLRQAQFAPAGAPPSTPHLYVEPAQAAGAK